MMIILKGRLRFINGGGAGGILPFLTHTTNSDEGVSELCGRLLFLRKFYSLVLFILCATNFYRFLITNSGEQDLFFGPNIVCKH